MAKFIKFTNVKPFDILGNTLNVLDEFVISSDEIVSIGIKGNEFVLSTKAYVAEQNHKSGRINFNSITQSVKISKDDYENAKKILLEV